MILNFRFIPGGIKGNGPPVQTAIQILQIMPCLIVLYAIILFIAGEDIPMLNVIVAIQEELQIKIN
jgi:hypothetical protein